MAIADPSQSWGNPQYGYTAPQGGGSGFFNLGSGSSAPPAPGSGQTSGYPTQGSNPTPATPPAQNYMDQAAQLYQSKYGRAGDPGGIQYWANELSHGTPMSTVQNQFNTAGTATDQSYVNNPQAYDAAHPGVSQYFENDPGLQSSLMAKYGGAYNPSGGGMGSEPMGANGIPNYWQIAQQQAQYNQQNAQDESELNNPNYYGPGGSQVRTKNADGTYSVTQSLNPALQANYDSSNQLQGNLLNRSNQLAGSSLNFNGAPAAPTFNTSGVSAIPTADSNDLNTVRDSVYNQSTQYLDPQFQQAQGDLESKLANQGIMPGSAAYDREMNNFNLTKQKAYSDARNSAIQAGGAEQSRLFGLGLQSNQAGMNNALASFNTGMQGRQQGVAEDTALHNSPINDVNALKSSSQIQLPTFPGQVGTSIPGVNYLNAANMGFNANLDLQNAQAAQRANNMGGLFSLGNSLIQSGGLNGAGTAIGNLFGLGNSNYGNFLSSNSNFMNSQGLSPSDLLSAG